MAKPNPALFGPLQRIENAARRAANLLSSSAVAPRESELIAQEIREIEKALEAFKAALNAGEMPELSERDPVPRWHLSKGTLRSLRRPK